MIRSARFAPLPVFALALALYVVTLAPTLTWSHSGADGGDLIAAVVTQGVPHPPGYPAYVTLGALFAQLPIGNAAYRLNLFSAVCMASAAAFTTWGMRRVTQSGVVILAGLTFAAAPMVWGQATIAEVHALNALFVAVVLGLLAPIVFRSESVSISHLVLAFFLWGLGLGNQLTLLALIPIFVNASRVAFIIQHSSRITPHASRLAHYSLLVTVFLLGLSIYLLVPIRAAARPPINWLGEVSLPNVWSFITAELYRGYAFAVPISNLPARLIAFAQTLVAQFGWSGMLLGAIGVWRAIVKKQRGFASVCASASLYFIFALGYNTPDSDLYLIPIWLFGAWAIAVGAQTIINWLRSFIPHPSALSLVVVLLVPGLTVVSQFASHDLSTDRVAETFARRVLAGSPAAALLVTHTDAHTFALWYYRLVEQQRSDVTVIDARLAAYDWSAPMLHAQDKQLNVVDFDPETTWLDRLKAANPVRPVCEIDTIAAEIQCP